MTLETAHSPELVHALADSRVMWSLRVYSTPEKPDWGEDGYIRRPVDRRAPMRSDLARTGDRAIVILEKKERRSAILKNLGTGLVEKIIPLPDSSPRPVAIGTARLVSLATRPEGGLEQLWDFEPRAPIAAERLGL